MALTMAEASIRQEEPHAWYWSTLVVEDRLSGGGWIGIGQRGDHFDGCGGAEDGARSEWHSQRALDRRRRGRGRHTRQQTACIRRCVDLEQRRLWRAQGRSTGRIC